MSISVVGLIICAIGSQSLTGVIALGTSGLFITIFMWRYLVKHIYITTGAFIVLIVGFIIINNSTGNLGEEILQQIHFILSTISAKTCEQTEFAEVDPVKCALCYTCYRACPHAAMVPNEENSAMKNLNTACQVCGICVTICPAGAIKIKGKSHDPETVPNTLKVYGCENSGEIALKKISEELAGLYDKISVSAVSCGGEITAEKIIDELKNYKKVLYVTCMYGACRHFDGNKRARLQVLRAKEMLKSAGLDENRVVYVQVSPAMPFVLKDEMEGLL
jgi:NAD-dependent dihydropyrimidine dehydrogenase PreA subunit/coenzyme F420-reducing hydrogenase delta subunit